MSLAREEPGEHVPLPHVAQSLGRRAQLHPVIRCCRGCAEQPIGNRAHELGDLLAALAVEVLQDRTFVADYASVPVWLEQMQLFVVRDLDHSIPVYARPRTSRLDAELLSFIQRLPGDAQRSQDQHRLVGVLNHVLRPHQLHRRLAQSTVRKDRGASKPDGPLCEVLLEVV